VLVVIGYYLIRNRKVSETTTEKIEKAKEFGLHEPVSIHPYVDPGICIGSGACISACPEKDILGLVKGRAATIHASRCIGHGACAAACPVGAISLVFGTESRGVEIPFVSPKFETNLPGVFIVGELGGMGLIKNAVVQGREAVEYIAARERRSDKKTTVQTERRENNAIDDILIIGAGPAGISASLAARRYNLRCTTIDQSDIGGSVLQYPRHKIVMTSPVELPIYGKMKLRETSKEALLDLWTDVIRKTGLKFNTYEKMTELVRENGYFKVVTTKGEYRARHVVLAIGRRGTPRKLDVPGENLSKVTYRLLEPEQHRDQPLLVVGGGDSAVEAALALAEQPGNRVTLSYRQAVFSRIKPANQQRLDAARAGKRLDILLQSEVSEIREKEVVLRINEQVRTLPNDYVYIFAGGELPNEFLRKIGVRIEKKFGKV